MKTFIILILGMGLFANAYSDEIYRYRDKNGTLKYSDKKPKTKHDVLDKGDYRGRREPAKQPAETVAEEELKRDMKDINTVTNTAKKDIDAIYKTIYQKDNKVKGSVVVSFSIQPQGAATNCIEDESQMTRPVFNNRICGRIQQLNYGALQTETPTKVKYTYTFTPAS
ncbi:MAG: AgmX/PglI C-terminal domain-containing protein [Cellvibrionaceae bacterium]